MNEKPRTYSAKEIEKILWNEHGINRDSARVLIQFAISYGQIRIGCKDSASWRGYSPAESVTITNHEDYPFPMNGLSIEPDPHYVTLQFPGMPPVMGISGPITEESGE